MRFPQSQTAHSPFGHDAAARLTSASLTGAPAPGTANFSYTYAYNELGNITSRNGTAPTLNYTYADPLHKQAVTQAAGGGTTYAYTYGTRGNLLTRTVNAGPTTTYGFDVENRLTSISGGATATFAYDAGGQRVKAVMSGKTVYTPFPDYELTDPPTGADQIRISYRLAGRIVAVRTSTGAINHVAFDHLGSVGALFNGSGTYIGTSLSRFDPFGNFRTPPTGSNPTITNHGYTGHRHNNTGDDNLGLIYMNARYYLPEVGRFISPDTIVPDPGNPQSYNRYAYALNSPVNYTDPSGHCVFAFPFDTTLCAIAFGALTVVAYDAVSPDFNAASAAGEAAADLALQAYDNVRYAISNSDANDEPVSNPLQELAGHVAGSPGDFDPNDFDRDPQSANPWGRNYQENYEVHHGQRSPTTHEVHHIFPQRYRGIMQRAGINIDDPRWLRELPRVRGVLPDGSYGSIHQKYYTDVWNKWHRSLGGRQPTAEEILKFARDLEGRYIMDFDTAFYRKGGYVDWQSLVGLSGN